uniref:Uncharacterized protein n=1 Tax=Cucumis sativus TaxID=3659 RepID=A0A0A0LV86_CUCSA
MAQYASLVHTSLLNYGFTHKMNPSYWRYDMVKSRPSPQRSFRVKVVQDTEGPSRIVDIIRLVPELSRNYFRTFGVNDVFATVVCILLTDVTRFYYNRPKVTFPIALLNNFKMGFTCGLFIDAFKLTI